MAAFGLPENFRVGVLNFPKYLNDEFELMTAKYNIMFVDIKTKGKDANRRFGENTVQKVIKKCKEKGIHMVLSISEGDNKTQSRVNAALGYPGVSDTSLLSLSSKFISRGIDLEKLWRVPVDPYVENPADFEKMIAAVPAWPAILKNNLHTGGGYGVFCVKTPDALLQKLLEIRADQDFEQLLREERDWFLDGVPKEELKDDVVPFFHVEEMVRLGEGCIQYCVDGFVDENGKVGIWGIFEEMYTPDDQTFGYVTPPINLKPAQAPIIEKYVKDYMAQVVKQGWKNQAFCAELWYRAEENIIWLTEVNPRAAWAYARSYRHTYNAHLINMITLSAAGKGSLIEMDNCPWKKWVEDRDMKGPTLVTVVSPTRAGRIGDLICYDHINDLRARGRLVRDMIGPEYVIRQEDVACSAGYWVLYVYYHGKSIEDLAQQEREDRDGFHIFPQLGFEYPPFWPAHAPVRKRSVIVNNVTCSQEALNGVA